MTNARKNNFDFLRLAAAAGVVLCHSYMLLGKISDDPLYNLTGWHLGGTSLSVFFLISGYLITMSFENRPDTYWRSRFLRIFPALFVNILFTVFILGAVYTNLDKGQYFTNSKTYEYLLNIFVLPLIRFLPGVFIHNHNDNIVNGSIWTLGSELMLYFYIWLAGTLGFSFKKTIPAIFAILAVVYLTNFNFYMRAIGDALITIYPDFEMAVFFMIGAAFHVFKINSNKFPVLLLLFIASSIAGYFGMHMLSLYLLLPYLVFYIAFSPSIKLSRFARYGDFSYGVYIYAYPVQQALIASFSDMSPLLLFIYTLAITLIFAFASWHLIEKKALALKAKPRNSP